MKTWIGRGSGRDKAIPWSTPHLLASQDNPEAFVSEWRQAILPTAGATNAGLSSPSRREGVRGAIKTTAQRTL